MFIKLTKFDGSPIWLNASFVVTVEPRKDGGSTVVPIGDGLDYDVKESPETVLSALDGAPVPEVVPVASSDALTATPADVSPETGSQEDSSTAGAETVPVIKKPARKRTKAKTDGEKSEKTKISRRRKKPVLDLNEEEIARLKKLAPRSVKKLANTISAQFKVIDVDNTIAALVAEKIVIVEGDHVIW